MVAVAVVVVAVVVVWAFNSSTGEVETGRSL